jgi:hypothetical protein
MGLPDGLLVRRVDQTEGGRPDVVEPVGQEPHAIPVLASERSRMRDGDRMRGRALDVVAVHVERHGSPHPELLPVSRRCCLGMSSSSWNSETSGIKPVTVHGASACRRSGSAGCCSRVNGRPRRAG